MSRRGPSERWRGSFQEPPPTHDRGDPELRALRAAAVAAARPKGLFFLAHPFTCRGGRIMEARVRSLCRIPRMAPIALLTWLASVVAAAEIHVDADFTGAGDGSEAAPFQTIAEALAI